MPDYAVNSMRPDLFQAMRVCVCVCVCVSLRVSVRCGEGRGGGEEETSRVGECVHWHVCIRWNSIGAEGAADFVAILAGLSGLRFLGLE
jgi:hypothetical protein